MAPSDAKGSYSNFCFLYLQPVLLFVFLPRFPIQIIVKANQIFVKIFLLNSRVIKAHGKNAKGKTQSNPIVLYLF